MTTQTGQGPRPDSLDGRYSGGQQLRQSKPQPLRSVPPGRLSFHPSRDNAVWEVHLPDVFLDQGDCDSALDCAFDEPAQAGARGLQPERVITGWLSSLIHTNQRV